MMVTTQGEDYVIFAEAKGLRSPTIFLRYCVRNALLPQATGLALALGQIVSGAVLVEVIFGYPGIGTVLFQAIRENDHFLIQGIVFTVIIALGLATLHPRRDLSPPRSAHHLPQGVTLRVTGPTLGAASPPRRGGRRSRPRSATCAATSPLVLGLVLLGGAGRVRGHRTSRRRHGEGAAAVGARRSGRPPRSIPWARTGRGGISWPSWWPGRR